MNTATSFGERELRVHCVDSEPDSGWHFFFGAYGDTQVAILGCGLSLEDALEEAFEWLDDYAPGTLHTIGEADYELAAAELGVSWAPQRVSDDDISRVTERAETDMTMCSHTTLKHGNCIPSWEWHVNEITGSALEELCAAAREES